MIPINVFGPGMCQWDFAPRQSAPSNPAFRDQTNSENQLPRRVQKLHLPFVVVLELAGNAADEIAANAGQLFSSGIMVGELGTAIAGAVVLANAKEIQRHDTKPMLEGRP